MKKLLLVSCLIVAWTGFVSAGNNALDFDGTDDYVNCGNNSTLQVTGDAITLEAWINPESFGSASFEKSIIDKHGTETKGYVLRCGGSGILNFNFGDGSHWYEIESPSNALMIGTWHHVAGVYNGSTQKLYVDGIEVNSLTCTASISDNSGDVCVGGAAAYPGRLFDGKIDEVRIWNDARTISEIRQNMYRELTNPSSETNLVAYYKFNETSGPSLADSKNSNNGTLINYGSQTGYWQTSPAMFGPKNCLNFDGGLNSGNPDYAYKTTNVTSVTDNFTMMAWIKPDDVTDGTNGWRCVAYNGDDGGGYGFGISNSKVSGLFGSTQWHVTDEVLSNGRWYYITMRRSSGTVQFFLNGKLLGYSNTTAPYTPSSNFTIGNMFNSDGSTLYTDSFDGQIDEVRVYDAALTDLQIRDNMCNTIKGDESNLVAYYNFDNTSGTKLQSFDGSTTNDLTLVNISNDDWVSSSAFNTWLNSSSSSWSTATNWSRGSVPGSSDNVGIYTYSGGTNVSLSGLPTVNNLVLGGSSSVMLSSGVTVNGNLILESNLDLNGQTITLGSSAELVEDDGLLSGTSGSISTTRDLSNIDENVAGLGAEITTSANMGSTTIIRSHAAPGNQAIKRKYHINPTTNTGLSATLIYHYDDSELNGQTESELKLFKSSDGSTWAEQSANTINTTTNTITLTGIDAFSYWTAAPTGSDASLPVELTGFKVENWSGGVLLKWITESEIENLGFIIQRKISVGANHDLPSEWSQIASYIDNKTLEGHGSTTEKNDYQYSDQAVQPGVTYEYRLGDVDYYGKVKWHKTVTITIEAEDAQIPKEFGLQRAYPNPFNPAVTLSYDLTDAGQITLQVYNMRGQLVKTLVSDFQHIGTYKFVWQPENLSAGVYIVRLQSDNKTNLHKIVFVK